MPLARNIHIDRALTNFSVAISQTGLVASMVWPEVKVKMDSDKYFVYDNSNLRLDETAWAERDVANEVDWEATPSAYVTERHALKKLVTDKERRNADAPIKVDRDTTTILTEKLMLRREKRLADILQTAANYDADKKPTLVLATQWDNYTSATSDPAKDVATARLAIAKAVGKKINLMLLPNEVFEKLREHPLIIDRVKYTKTGIINVTDLEALFDIERIIVTDAIENTANEGQADVLGFIWGKNVYMGYVTKTATLRSPSWGYHIQSQKMLTERWKEEERKGDMLRVSYEDVPKLVTQSAGYIIQSAVA